MHVYVCSAYMWFCIYIYIYTSDIYIHNGYIDVYETHICVCIYMYIHIFIANSRIFMN